MKKTPSLRLCVLCAVYCCLPLTRVEAAESQLTFTPAEVSVGEIHVGDSRNFTVNIKNPTDKPITASGLHGSCGCVTPTFLTTDTPPAAVQTTVVSTTATTILNIKYHGLYGKKKGDTVYVMFTTDEADTPQIRIPVHADVIQEFAFEPERMAFNPASAPLAKGITKTLECVMKSLDGKPFEITRLNAYNKEFTVDYAPVEGSNKSAYKITVTIKTEKGGPLNETCLVQTDRPDAAGMAQLYLNASVSADAVCTPDIINAEVDGKGGVAPFQAVTVKRLTPGKLEITGVTETRQAGLEFSVTPVAGDDASAQVTIHLTDPADKQWALGQILIQTNADEGPIHVPYRIHLPKGVGFGHY